MTSSKSDRKAKILSQNFDQFNYITLKTFQMTPEKIKLDSKNLTHAHIYIYIVYVLIYWV